MREILEKIVKPRLKVLSDSKETYQPTKDSAIDLASEFIVGELVVIIHEQRADAVKDFAQKFAGHYFSNIEGFVEEYLKEQNI